MMLPMCAEMVRDGRVCLLTDIDDRQVWLTTVCHQPL